MLPYPLYRVILTLWLWMDSLSDVIKTVIVMIRGTRILVNHGEPDALEVVGRIPTFTCD